MHSDLGRHAAGNPVHEQQWQGFLTLMTGGQLCGVPVLAVRDVIAGSTVTRIPLAPPEIAGNINLRGRIVTAIDLRRRLALPSPPHGQASSLVAVVAEAQNGAYALLVDQALEVLTLDAAEIEALPPTLSTAWRENARGIFRLSGLLMVVLDLDRLLCLERKQIA